MYSPNSLLRESVTGGDLHKHRALLHRHRALASQAPGLASWVELPEVLDVPSVLDGDAVSRLHAYGSRPRDMGNPERALPHGRELV